MDRSSLAGTLLAVRAAQLQFQRENLDEAVQRVRRLRREAIESRNEREAVEVEFEPGDLVWIWDSMKAVDWSH
jgi:hypothetical protein